MIRHLAFHILILGLLSSHCAHATSDWQLKGDEEVFRARPVSFNFHSKTLELQEPNTLVRKEINTRDLSLSSKRQLLFSGIFHSSYPREPHPWPKEKIRLLLLAAFAPIAICVLAFWISGLILTGRFSPFRAIFGFFGSWIAGLILMACYLYFSHRAGGSSSVLGFGGLVTTAIVSVYVSAVYSCKIWQGLSIFLLHIVASVVLAICLLFGTEKVVPLEKVEAFWDERVFIPVGLMDPPGK